VEKGKMSRRGEERMSEERNGSGPASQGEGLTPGAGGKTTTTRDPATDETVSTSGGRSEAEGEPEGPGDARAESDYRSADMPEGVPQDAPETDAGGTPGPRPRGVSFGGAEGGAETESDAGAGETKPGT
jgi:hypothetical protein